jgi:outer membrane protein assembly factor BamB
VVRWLLLVALTVGALAGSAEGTPTQACAGALIVSAKTGKVLRRLPAPVYSVVADGHGGWYVANVRLRHVLRDGRADGTWHSPVRRSLPYWTRSAPGTLVRHEGRLCTAGRRRVAAVDAATGHVLWFSSRISGPMVDGRRPTISVLAVGPGVVYVGGTFAGFGRARRAGLAALDTSTGALLPWQARAAAPVSLLALSGSTLYLSGTSSVSAVRTSEGRPTSFVPRARITGPIMLAVRGRLVLIGCSSRWSVCETDSGVFDGRTGNRVHKFAFDEVTSAGAVGFSGSTAYLGAGAEGDFGGQHYLIAIDLRTGRFKPWFPKSGYYAGATEIAVSGDRVFVAGSFCPGP